MAVQWTLLSRQTEGQKRADNKEIQINLSQMATKTSQNEEKRSISTTYFFLNKQKGLCDHAKKFQSKC